MNRTSAVRDFTFPSSGKRLTHSVLLYCLCENQALGVCTLTQTPTITLSTGLKPVPGFGRMPLSLSLSQQELEGSDAVSYDDIAPADQLIIINVGGKKKNIITTQYLKKRSES